MKITITRSFSKKVQLKQFEPVDAFCAITFEWEALNNTDKGIAEMEINSSLADHFCRAEVDKTLAQLRPSLKTGIIGKGAAEHKDIARDEAQNDAGPKN